MQSPRRRVAAIAALAFLTAVPFTFAANPRAAVAHAARRPVVVHRMTTVVVPNVLGQPYVFAKSALEDGGFAWRVTRGKGFAANVVVAQRPAPGTRLVDTGAPLVTLQLARNRSYGQNGTADDRSPYRATRLEVAPS
jgi:hypothetical protein